MNVVSGHGSKLANDVMQAHNGSVLLVVRSRIGVRKHSG